jgi:DnaA family protein
MQQLPLGWRWPAQQRFDSFHVGATNGSALDVVRRAAEMEAAPWVFVSGTAGSGKTHLLIAACNAAQSQSRRAQYVPLRTLSGARDGTVRGLGGCDLLALDDVDALAGDRDAEHALFDLYNRCRAEGSTLLFSAATPPAQAGITLPDLVSRLAICTQATLKPLDDGERRSVLRARAEARGIELDDAVLDFLFNRYARDLGSLATLLDRIDRESLAAKRRVTVPFLRGLLEREA